MGEYSTNIIFRPIYAATYRTPTSPPSSIIPNHWYNRACETYPASLKCGHRTQANDTRPIPTSSASSYGNHKSIIRSILHISPHITTKPSVEISLTNDFVSFPSLPSPIPHQLAYRISPSAVLPSLIRCARKIGGAMVLVSARED